MLKRDSGGEILLVIFRWAHFTHLFGEGKKFLKVGLSVPLRKRAGWNAVSTTCVSGWVPLEESAALG
jgi:hypothetical protein